MMELYFAPTANGLRATVALEETGLPYRTHKLDLAKGEQRSAEFLKLNPAGLIPVVVDPQGPGGKPLTLSQSGAIILYAAEKSGRFLPKDAARRALAMQWMMQAGSDIAGTSGTVFRMESSVPERPPRTPTISSNGCSAFSQYVMRIWPGASISRTSFPLPTSCCIRTLRRAKR